MKCIIPNCPDEATAKNMCPPHYERYKRGLRGDKLNAPINKHGQPLAAVGYQEPASAPSIDEQILYLRKANKTLESTIRDLHKTVGEQREIADAIRGTLLAADPFPRAPEISRADRKGKVEIRVGLKVSDWHIGEVIDALETEGFGGYNYQIAQERIFRIIDSLVKWVGVLRSGYVISELDIFGEGDYISGNIHNELRVTNEFPAPVQTAKAGLLLGEAVARLAPHFDTVRLHQVGADNHGRLEPKPQFKQKFFNSFSYLVHIISEVYLAKHKNVQVIPANGIKYLADIFGWKFLIEHGDTVKSWMGIPYYGIERSRAREATKRMNTDRTFHYQSIGHWHVPAWVSGNVLVNGSLSGTTEFDHGCGRHSAPSQVAFLVSQKHGVFSFTPFYA